jgi:hypothetical protein
MPLDLALILYPVGQQFKTVDDVVLFVLAYSGYLLLMVIAMYPGLLSVVIGAHRESSEGAIQGDARRT